jgi:hypothetical protein
MATYSYSNTTAKLNGVLAPFMRAGPIVPDRAFPFSGTPTFGVAASDPLWSDQASFDGGFPLQAVTGWQVFALNALVANPVPIVDIGSDVISPNLLGYPFFTQWNGFLAMADFNVSAFSLGFITAYNGLVQTAIGGTPPWWTNENVNGTPLVWQGSLYLVGALDTTPSGFALLIAPASLSNVEVWQGMDLAQTGNAPLTFPDTGDGFNYFLQDGTASSDKRPSIVKASSRNGATASAVKVTLDSPYWDSVLRGIIAAGSTAQVVPGGFIFTGQGQFILLAKDGSAYTVIVPVAGDAVAQDLFGLAFGPVGTPGNEWSSAVINGLPDRSGGFWMVSQQGSANDGATLYAPLYPPPPSVYTVTIGCWPCLPVANGIR